MIVDSHHHLWSPARGDYGWIPEGDPILDRPYAPRDIAPILRASGVTGTVLVQAAPSLHETEYLLGLADGTDFIKGVVGWIDFESRDDLAHLKRLARHPRFKAVRPMIQDIPDVDWMLRPDIQWAFEALTDLGLAFDALGFPRHIPNFLTLLKRHPRMRTVLDHCLKPEIRDPSPETFRSWADGMSRLAQETTAYVKLSGLVTEATPEWTTETLRPYAEHILREFGPARVMWGSDWPVCRLRCGYETWMDAARTLTEDLPAEARLRIWGGTAAEVYRLPM